ncbi:succinate dehydrogenase cytochrome b560 subunit, mitochondrial isoform X2 [Drosophila ficusphila]|nr:succinate dehydrogenase cytochrome b560 subunit, mitochondrial isoform X2 [Drosophila ficusphila]
MPPDLPYDDRNELLGRQLSPHLSIYKIQLTSTLSAFLRISGFVLAVFVWVLGIGGLLLQGDMEGFVKEVEKCDCKALVTMTKVVVAVPFAYHLVAGTRHLIWYLNKFLTIPEVYATGYVAVVLSIALAAGLLIADVGEKVKEQVVDLSKQGKKQAPKKVETKKEPPKKEASKDAKKGKEEPKKDAKGKKKEDDGKSTK